MTNNTIRLLPCDCISVDRRHDDWNTTSTNDDVMPHTTLFVLNMTHVLQQLYHQYHIRSIMVEGGATTLSTFLFGAPSSVDAVVITIAPQLLGNGIRLMDPRQLGRRKHTKALRLVPSPTSFVLVGNDATFISRCNQSAP